MARRQQAASRKAPSSAYSASRTKSIPPFYAPAPASLSPFLEILNPARCYIFHIDRLAPSSKRQLFAVPVAMNVAIVLLLAWRAYYVLPHYLDLIFLSLGVPTRAAIDRSDKSQSDLLGITIRRALMILGDFLLFKFLGSWAWGFFVGFDGQASPAIWRWRVWFKPQEVIVRVSRRWGEEEFWDSVKKAEGVAVGMQNEVMRDRIASAVDLQWLRTKTGYVTMGMHWDLDFDAMITAHEMLDEKQVVIEDFDVCVVVHGGEQVGWCIWRVDGEASASSSAGLGERDEQAKQAINVFKDKLTKMGKESLFFRWCELLQYHSTQPGGFTEKKQADFVGAAKETFEAQGVDFDSLMADIGGAQRLPGLESAPME